MSALRHRRARTPDLISTTESTETTEQTTSTMESMKKEFNFSVPISVHSVFSVVPIPLQVLHVLRGEIDPPLLPGSAVGEPGVQLINREKYLPRRIRGTPRDGGSPRFAGADRRLQADVGAAVAGGKGGGMFVTGCG